MMAALTLHLQLSVKAMPACHGDYGRPLLLLPATWLPYAMGLATSLVLIDM